MDTSSVEFAPIVERLQRKLGSAVDAETLQALLAKRMVEAYADARVTAFVPIFLFRDVLDEMRQSAGRDTTQQ